MYILKCVIILIDNSVHKSKIDEALLDMVTIDLQPASIVEDTGFLKLLESLDPRYVPPSRCSVMRSLLPARYECIKQKICSELSEVQSCAITSDFWTARTSELHNCNMPFC